MGYSVETADCKTIYAFHLIPMQRCNGQGETRNPGRFVISLKLPRGKSEITTFWANTGPSVNDTRTQLTQAPEWGRTSLDKSCPAELNKTTVISGANSSEEGNVIPTCNLWLSAPDFWSFSWLLSITGISRKEEEKQCLEINYIVRRLVEEELHYSTA